MRTDKEEGVRVAKAAPDCRTATGSCNGERHTCEGLGPKDGLGPSSSRHLEVKGKLMQSGGDWEEFEIQRFLRRNDRFLNEGLPELQSEALAQTMLYRDRDGSGDDRRICIECKHIKGSLCRHPKLKIVSPVRFILKRCDGFELIGQK